MFYWACSIAFDFMDIQVLQHLKADCWYKQSHVRSPSITPPVTLRMSFDLGTFFFADSEELIQFILGLCYLKAWVFLFYFSMCISGSQEALSASYSKSEKWKHNSCITGSVHTAQLLCTSYQKVLMTMRE